MPLWMCDVLACQLPSVRVHGDCVICQRHLCSEHLQRPVHQCPRWEDAKAYDKGQDLSIQLELQSLLAKIDIEALAKKASQVRGDNINCTPLVPNLDEDSLSSSMGGVNYHIELRFDDDVRWIARIKRQNASTPPTPIANYLIRSEAATYHFLARTSIPAPRVFDVVLGADNPVGTGYILMEKVSGRSLNSVGPTQNGMQKVMKQLANVYVELERHPFPAIGSLDQHDTDHIGPLASELLTDFDPTIGPSFSGPFSTTTAHHEGMITRILDMISAGQMYSLWAVEAFLIHRFLLDLIPLLNPPSSCPTKDSGGQEEFFLRHADDLGTHILIDDDCNITGIIDWEWASTVPRSEAFSSPKALWLVGDFFDGKNELSDGEIKFAEMLDTASPPSQDGVDRSLGKYVREGRKWQRFTFCAGYEVQDWNWENYKMLFEGLRKAFDIDAGLTWNEWKDQALDRYREDEQLKVLLDAERRAGVLL